MKKNFTIIICGLMIIGLAGCVKNKEYKIDLYKLDDVSNITIDILSQYDNLKEFTDEITINKIYSVFNDKTTYTKSVNDNPIEPDVLYAVQFKNKNNDSKTIYIYKKGKNFYIEQPYNGIYETTEEEFNTIESFIK